MQLSTVARQEELAVNDARRHFSRSKEFREEVPGLDRVLLLAPFIVQLKGTNQEAIGRLFVRALDGEAALQNVERSIISQNEIAIKLPGHWRLLGRVGPFADCPVST
jgi:hypothetical protein